MTTRALPPCPKCQSALAYQDGEQLVCPLCGHEWQAQDQVEDDAERTWRDAVGNLLQNGDTVVLVKDLKLKGASSVLKVGLKVKNIRLVEGDHDIDCKVEGIGAIQLKSAFVKKA